MPVEPASALSVLASVLSAAASVKTLVQKRHISKRQALAVLKQQAQGDEREFLEDPENEAAVLEITVIPAQLLGELHKKLQECIDEHTKAIRRAGHDQLPQDIADQKAAECVCNTLRRIMKHNGGTLPQHGPFNQYWISYNCTG